MKRYLVSLVLAVTMVLGGLAGCASTPQSAEQGVFQAKQNYRIALVAAVAYKNLPLCPTVTKVCSDPKVVRQLQAADNAAILLLDGAEVAARSGGSGADMAIKAAEQAVGALDSIIKMVEAYQK